MIMVYTAIAREGETSAPPGRSNRVYHLESGWYFHTREGKDAGPYGSRAEAEQGVADFVEFLAVADWQTRIKYLASITSTSHTYGARKPGNL